MGAGDVFCIELQNHKECGLGELQRILKMDMFHKGVSHDTQVIAACTLEWRHAQDKDSYF